jgi:hypothetical protein
MTEMSHHKRTVGEPMAQFRGQTDHVVCEVGRNVLVTIILIFAGYGGPAILVLQHTG